MKGLEPYEAAAREALEEGGVYGKTGAKAVGRYRYYRKSKKGARVHVVSVYLIVVRGALDHWQEKAERERGWFSVSSAARRVAEPELRSIIRRVEKVRQHPEWQRVGQLRAHPANVE
jgi:ADP-ribose pyrophosphatase YjhB (NUDIX family)